MYVTTSVCYMYIIQIAYKDVYLIAITPQFKKSCKVFYKKTQKCFLYTNNGTLFADTKIFEYNV